MRNPFHIHVSSLDLIGLVDMYWISVVCDTKDCGVWMLFLPMRELSARGFVQSETHRPSTYSFAFTVGDKRPRDEWAYSFVWKLDPANQKLHEIHDLIIA
jgi:hypothetical protein